MQRGYLFFVLVLVPLLLGVGRCWNNDALTAEEAQQSLEEVSLSSQALTLASGTVEISTNFTIGQAVEEAARDLRDFIESQLPCAEIVLSGATLNVVYGAKPGNCTYNGQTYSGTHTITVSSTAIGNLVVDHTWKNLANQTVSVSGTAHVTWSAWNVSRQIEHDLTWTRTSNNTVTKGRGDRTQTLLQGGAGEGIEVDGDRYWKSSLGDWDLEIKGVEIRWIDPVPQSGSYILDTPFDKTVTLTFDRVDWDTIQVTISSGQKSFTFHVSKLGLITNAE